MARAYGYNDSVFFNCPFDTAYMPLFRAIIFSIYRCGFYPKSALSEDNGLDNRLDKIVRLTKSCRFGIHDISRTEVNRHGYPRFNMPFELGIFFGAKRFGNPEQRKKNALIFEGTAYSYQQYCSDLNGVDIKAHQDDPVSAAVQVRDWLRTTSKRRSLPTPATLRSELARFENGLPAVARDLGFAPGKIPFNDLCVIVEKAIAKQSR
jgi:hypothetical protein